MRLFEQGKFEEGANAFDSLAHEAEEGMMFFQAANLAVQAARCYMRIDDFDQAYERGMKALVLFERADRPAAARRVAERMMRILRDRNREAEAEDLERQLRQLRVAPGAAARRGELPGKCPQCGGPIKEAEATWVGPSSAECPYCGSIVKAL